jgi:hypothetical protein
MPIISNEFALKSSTVIVLIFFISFKATVDIKYGLDITI